MPDGLVQLRIQNFVTKFNIQNLERGGMQPGGGGGGGSGVGSVNRGVKRKVETGCHGPDREGLASRKFEKQ